MSLTMSTPPLPAVLLTERLQTPSGDNRKFRLIELSNRLEVLLICDPDAEKAGAAMDVKAGNFADNSDMLDVAEGTA